MGMIKSFDIENLLPFKRREGMPNTARPAEDKITDLDPTLNHEEQIYVGHYIGYADQMLGIPPPQQQPIEKRVVEIPARKEPDVPTEKEKQDEVA
jgi:hypothetical protein